MLNSKFARTVFCSHLMLFIAFPFTSYQRNSAHRAVPEDSAAVLSPAAAASIQLNKNAVKYVRNYIRQNNDDLVMIKLRSKMPFRTMDQVFRKYGLPLQLKYLAVIESELKSTAVSRVGAVGPWQLMPSTARQLGLKVAMGADERKQYYKSTRAAAIYLRDLYGEFGDWLLVMAAYNCGPGPVYTAIHRSGSRNFWSLQNYLPRESREHVKKFIATHYYFEGQGSVTTLTKAENLRYQIIQNFVAAQKGPLRANQEAMYAAMDAGFIQSMAYQK